MESQDFSNWTNDRINRWRRDISPLVKRILLFFSSVDETPGRPVTSLSRD